MYSDMDARLMMRDEAGATRAERRRRRSLLTSHTVAMLLLVLMALALVASEASAGEPDPGIDREALLADFRASIRPDVSAAASEVLGEIRSSALQGQEAAAETLQAASVEPAPEADDADDLFVEVTVKRRSVDEVVASNDDALRF